MTATIFRHQTPPPGGDGRSTLLVLPGMTLNGTIMPPFPWDSLSVDFTGFRPGLPDAGIDMSVYRRALDALLAETPSWHRAQRIVVAHSFGGMLAIDWLLAHARRGVRAADALVLIATTGGPMFDVVRLRLGAVAGRDVRLPVKPLMPLWNRPAVTWIVKRLVTGRQDAAGQIDFGKLDPPSDLAVDLAGWRNTDWRSMRAYRLAMRGWDRRDELVRVDLPTVVLHGSRDSLFPVAVARDLAHRLPRAHLRIVDGAGHVLPLTHGDEVIAAVKDLLARLHR
jgi:pimeloyl-ACP methyl ester carboxylesterase